MVTKKNIWFIFCKN